MLVAYLYGRSSCLEADRHTHQNCYGDPEKIKEGGGASWFHQSSDAGMFGLETSNGVCVVIDWPSALATQIQMEPDSTMLEAVDRKASRDAVRNCGRNQQR